MSDHPDDPEPAGASAGAHGTARSGAADDDAARLVSSVLAWAQERAQEWTDRNLAEGSGHFAGGDCTWCPLCQFVSVLRGDRPELTDRVTETGAAVVTAVRAFVDAAVAAAGSAAGSATGAGTAGPAQPAAPRVQRIDLVERP
jgi:hypothetical protein